MLPFPFILPWPVSRTILGFFHLENIDFLSFSSRVSLPWRREEGKARSNAHVFALRVCGAGMRASLSVKSETRREFFHFSGFNLMTFYPSPL